MGRHGGEVARRLQCRPGSLLFIADAGKHALDGLGERLAEYRKAGARFAKWRAVYDIGQGIPSYSNIRANGHALARYAALCQVNDIVPIVEPEVLMDGSHDIDTCAMVTEFVLKETFQELYYQKVPLEGMVLKPNMIVPGSSALARLGE